MSNFLSNIELPEKSTYELIKNNEKEKLAKKLLPFVKSISYKHTKTKDEFLEGVSTGISVILDKVDDYDESSGAKFQTYVYKFVQGAIIDDVSNFEKDHVHIDFDKVDGQSEYKKETDLELMIKKELMVEDHSIAKVMEDAVAEIVRKAVNHLRPTHKKIIYMQYWEDKTREEIGEFFGIGKSAVSTRIWRARKQLMAWFEKRGLGKEELLCK